MRADPNHHQKLKKIHEIFPFFINKDLFYHAKIYFYMIFNGPLRDY